jgi:Tol biopolymer transport system component
MTSILSIMTLLSLLTFVEVSHSGVAFSRLQDNVWRLVYKPSLTGEREFIRLPDSFSDAIAPAIGPNHRVAFEITGIGLVTCQLPSFTSCDTMRFDPGWASHPAWNPATHDLAFVGLLAGPMKEDADLYVLRRASSQPVPLLRQTGNQDDPAYSLDGRKLAYTSANVITMDKTPPTVYQNLWMLNLDAGEARQLTMGPWQDTHPRWSPDGRTLVYASNRTGAFEIWTLNIRSGTVRQLTSGAGTKTSPIWSPDGLSILHLLTIAGSTRLALLDPAKTLTRPQPSQILPTALDTRDPEWR